MDSKDSSMDTNSNEIVDGEFEEVSLGTEQAQSETRLAITPQMALAQAENRIWCAYCFRTLDPNHRDDTMRSAVRVGEVAYHRACWNRLSQPNGQPIEFLPPPPEPLRIVTLIGAPLYTGPINTLNDKPLGISDSLLVLDSLVPSTFTLRNNSAQLVQLDRRIMPAWAYVHYPSDDYADDHLFTLLPAQTAVIEVYPHLVRPDLVDVPLMLSETQSIMLESRSYPVVPIANLVGLYALFLWHLSTIFDLSRNYFFITRNFSSQGSLLIAPVFTCFLLVTILVLLTPGRVLWSIHSIVSRINKTSMRRLLGQPRTLILRILETGEVEQAQTRFHIPLTLIMIGIAAIGTIVVWVIILLVAGAIIGLSGLFFLAEAGILLFVIHRIGKEYGFDLVTVGESIIRQILRLAQIAGANRS